MIMASVIIMTGKSCGVAVPLATMTSTMSQCGSMRPIAIHGKMVDSRSDLTGLLSPSANIVLVPCRACQMVGMMMQCIARLTQEPRRDAPNCIPYRGIQPSKPKPTAAIAAIAPVRHVRKLAVSLSNGKAVELAWSERG